MQYVSSVWSGVGQLAFSLVKQMPCNPHFTGDHFGVPGSGGAVQGRVALAVARFQELAHLGDDHPGTVEEAVVVPA